jgi:hypothetical protein
MLIVLALGGLSLSLGAQEQTPSGNEAMDTMMAAYARYAAPGAEHRLLQKRAGTWDVTVRIWMAPGAPPEESKAVSECSVLMGGRYVQEKLEGTAMGRSFSGLGLTGFDNIKKKYVSIWIDNMGTGIMASEGAASADGKSLEYLGDLPDPVANKYRQQRMVETDVDADHRRTEAFDIGPDGKPFKSMEIIYIRRK